VGMARVGRKEVDEKILAGREREKAGWSNRE
jgi:hypothetical protein